MAVSAPAFASASVRQLVQQTGYPAWVVRRLRRNPEDGSARAWMRAHRHNVSPDVLQLAHAHPVSSPMRRSHRVVVVSLDHMEAFLDPLLTALPDEGSIEDLMLHEGERPHGASAARPLNRPWRVRGSSGPVLLRRVGPEDSARLQRWVDEGRLICRNH